MTVGSQGYPPAEAVDPTLPVDATPPVDPPPPVDPTPPVDPPPPGAHAAAGVRGVVTTADRWPVPGAAVTVVGPTGRQLGRTAADEGGGFEVPVAEAGPVTVVVAAAGVDPQARAVTLRPRQVVDLGVVLLGSQRRAELPARGLWTIDPIHSIVRATARHLAMSRIEGRFTAFAGVIRVADPPERSTVEVTIDAASIDTGNADRDAHLRSPDFLDVSRFPHLTYRSDAVRRASDTRWLVDGRLTIRDVTRPVGRYPHGPHRDHPAGAARLRDQLEHGPARRPRGGRADPARRAGRAGGTPGAGPVAPGAGSAGRMRVNAWSGTRAGRWSRWWPRRSRTSPR